MNETIVRTRNNRRWMWLLLVPLFLCICCLLTLVGYLLLQPRGSAPAYIAPVVSEPIAPVLKTDCGPAWKTDAGVTQFLLPGFSARGDVVADDVGYYDSGVGEGTTIRNMSDQPVKIFQEWGAGCEPTVDLKTLINKDLAVGCGDTGGCKVARIVTCTDSGCTQEFYSEPLP
jgi:phosphate-selective porin